MNNIVTRENILKEKTAEVPEENLVLKLFELAEELEIGNAVELDNLFSAAAQDFVLSEMKKRASVNLDRVYTSVLNIYYVVGLYLRGFENDEHYMGLEEFLILVKSGNAEKIIQESRDVFTLHINRLKKIIYKSKKKIPWGDAFFDETKSLLKEMDWDLTLCARYPATSASLPDFYYGQYHDPCKPVNRGKSYGFLSIERTIYSLYKELRIMTRFSTEYIDKICTMYLKNVGYNVSFNIFEKVMNNYLFALPYSDDPESLTITEVDAKLLIGEIKSGSLNADELINETMRRFEFKDYEKEYLIRYGEYIQRKILLMTDSNYFGELFIITAPK